ncbi:adenine nucleotide alpha hydrolases-like protein [Xylariaceae sp. FL0804]|nr:adenine nucleotide alpha hydrolases-like protein [Xylariaceae sp. FL0804]
MSKFPHFLHSAARPICVDEFVDALRAVGPPRSPSGTARRRRPRTVGLAVSGGVDSMALAFLCSRLSGPALRDSSSTGFFAGGDAIGALHGITVDHGLRDGSDREARDVRAALARMGIGVASASSASSASSACAAPLDWSRELLLASRRRGDDDDYQRQQQQQHPRDLPNLETVARRLRYRRLGLACARQGIASLLLAHHEDDQYETVLMRLLQGHGARGLRGMRSASPIPECEGEYALMSPDRHVDELDREIIRPSSGFPRDEAVAAAALERPPLAIEDGGVAVYRPLLAFSKDRLIATCEANNVPWWEDHTNRDPTLTLRNAVRHLYKGYALPPALKKPSILALSRRCEERCRALDAEADQLLAQTTIHDFNPNVGSVVVRFPEHGSWPSRVDLASAPQGEVVARRRRDREVAGLLLTRIIALVTPKSHDPPLASLGTVVSRLFPPLSGDVDGATNNPPAAPPKAFHFGELHFVPVRPKPSSSPPATRDHQSPGGPASGDDAGAAPPSWSICRAPYIATAPLPSSTHRPPPGCRGPASTSTTSSTTDPGHDDDGCGPWSPWQLWDGRFWLRVRRHHHHRSEDTAPLPPSPPEQPEPAVEDVDRGVVVVVVVRPFDPAHAATFRAALGPPAVARLDALLRRHAPAKSRWTLPALYGYCCTAPPPAPRDEDNDDESGSGSGGGSQQQQQPDDVVVAREEHDGRGSDDLRLLALPTLDVALPGLADRLRWQVRYRRVDRSTLERAGWGGC